MRLATIRSDSKICMISNLETGQTIQLEELNIYDVQKEFRKYGTLHRFFI